MRRWLPKVLKRLHEYAAAGQIRLTFKAAQETLLLGLSPEDVRDVIEGLDAHSFADRLASKATGEWMYVFKPDVGDQIIYLKLILRESCVVVSFHEDEG